MKSASYASSILSSSSVKLKFSKEKLSNSVSEESSCSRRIWTVFSGISYVSRMVLLPVVSSIWEENVCSVLEESTTVRYPSTRSSRRLRKRVSSWKKPTSGAPGGITSPAMVVERNVLPSMRVRLLTLRGSAFWYTRRGSGYGGDILTSSDWGIRSFALMPRSAPLQLRHRAESLNKERCNPESFVLRRRTLPYSREQFLLACQDCVRILPTRRQSCERFR